MAASGFVQFVRFSALITPIIGVGLVGGALGRLSEKSFADYFGLLDRASAATFFAAFSLLETIAALALVLGSVFSAVHKRNHVIMARLLYMSSAISALIAGLIYALGVSKAHHNYDVICGLLFGGTAAFTITTGLSFWDRFLSYRATDDAFVVALPLPDDTLFRLSGFSRILVFLLPAVALGLEISSTIGMADPYNNNSSVTKAAIAFGAIACTMLVAANMMLLLTMCIPAQIALRSDVLVGFLLGNTFFSVLAGMIHLFGKSTHPNIFYSSMSLGLLFTSAAFTFASGVMLMPEEEAAYAPSEGPVSAPPYAYAKPGRMLGSTGPAAPGQPPTYAQVAAYQV